MTIDVDISNQQSAMAIDDTIVRNVVNQVLNNERIEHAEISIAIVDNEAIHVLNRDYLNHDYPTDVLSFGLNTSALDDMGEQPQGLVPDAAGPGKIDGEIVISAEMAIQTADRFGWTAADELHLYLVHGLLHLCGYDDLTPDDQTRMRKRESAILAQLGMHVSYDDREQTLQ